MIPTFLTSSHELFIPGATWRDDDAADVCHARGCDKKLYVLSRHHCRWCGHVFCDTCAPRTTPHHGKLYRRCRSCQLPVIFRSFVHPVTGQREATPLHTILSFLTPRSGTALLQCSHTMLAEFPVPRCPYQPSIQARFPSFYAGALIGQGGFGAVYKCEDPKASTRQLVALKRLPKANTLSLHMWRRVETEMEAMRETTHPNVARLLEVFQTTRDLVVVMEAGEGGTARQACEYVRRHGLPLEPFVASVVLDVAKGLEYLFRERHMVHRDIKFENIVMSADYSKAMIIDFGLAEYVSLAGGTQPFTPAGTIGYASPENIAAVLAQMPLVATAETMMKGDLFSLGVVAYAMLTLRKPLRTKQFQTQFEELQRGLCFSGEWWRGVSAEAADFVAQLLKPDVTERADYRVIEAHPFIKEQAPRMHVIIAFRKASIQRDEDEERDEWVLVDGTNEHPDSSLERFPRQRRFYFRDLWNSNRLQYFNLWSTASPTT